jgi:translocation protein SEC62
MATANPAAGGPPPGQPMQQQIPPQILEMMKMEAAKRGMTLEQFQAFQKKTIEEEAAKLGITPQEYVARRQAEAREQMMKQRAAQQAQGGAPGQQQGQPQGPPGQKMQSLDITKPVEAKPDALALAIFLRSQNLKTRTCIFNGQRKDMFKGKPV